MSPRWSKNKVTKKARADDWSGQYIAEGKGNSTKEQCIATLVKQDWLVSY